MYTKWNNNSSWSYRKVNKPSYSAGVLPYTFDQTGKCFFLLGKDNDNDWSDFGGRSEFRDHNEPINTASREFYEETLGSVMSISESIGKLGHGKPTTILSKTLNGSPYYMYLMYVDYYNYSDSFNKTASFLKYQFDKQETNRLIEKNTIRWVSMDTILMCLENETGNPIHLRGVFYKTLMNSKEQLQMLIK
jgi:hypothetical protein